MKIGCFHVYEPLPDINECYAIATIQPWIDVNNVGTMVLNDLETRFNALEVASLPRPSRFYDYTRYRPTIHIEGGIRDLSISNTIVQFAERENQPPLLLLRLLEPHNQAELYVASVIKLLKFMKVSRYSLIGSMFDAVPHTRPLLVSGYGMGSQAVQDIRKTGTLPISYHGPSSMVNQVTVMTAEAGIPTAAYIVSLPQYVALEEDFLGKVRLMEILNILYNVPVDKEDFHKARDQRNAISNRVETSSEARILLHQLETAYDMRIQTMEEQGTSPLTTEMEEVFWKILGDDVGNA
jgi:hypothetical protein